jgi:uncharacterized protein (DUF58 family)
MKRIVRSEIRLASVVGVAAFAIVSTTGAGTGATYLITLGLLAVALAFHFGPERIQLRREKHTEVPVRKS